MRRRPDMADSNLRGFFHDADGVAAVEFTIILPFMLVLYLGSLEFGNAMAVQFKTALATAQAGRIASRSRSVLRIIIQASVQSSVFCHFDT